MKRLVCLIVVLIATVCVGAPEPLGLKYEPTDPEFLVPVKPYGRDYEEAVERILGKRRGLATMIYETVGEFKAVSAWGEGGETDVRPKRAFITYLELDGAGPNAKAKKDVDVPVDVDFAIAVQRAWAAMLLKTRYPEKVFLGADGYSVEFSTEVNGLGGVYGYAWSPSHGLTKEMVELSFQLADYCKAPAAERPQRREKLMSRLKEFEEKVSKAK